MRAEDLLTRLARKVELAQPCALEGCDKIERYDHNDSFCTWHRRRMALSMNEDSWCKACGIGSKVDFKIAKRRITYSTSLPEATHAYEETDSESCEDEDDGEDRSVEDDLWMKTLKDTDGRGPNIQWTGGWVFRRGNIANQLSTHSTLFPYFLSIRGAP